MPSSVFRLARGPARRVLVLELDDGFDGASTIRDILSSAGYEVEVAAVASAQDRFQAFSPHLVIADVHRAPLELAPILVIADRGGRDVAMDAVRRGAAGYLIRPIHRGELLLAVTRILELESLRGDLARLRGRTDDVACVRRMVGSSPGIENVRQVLLQAAGSEAPLLFLGERGTGKSLAALLLHQARADRSGPFLAGDSAALSAAGIRDLLCASHHGTLFLDDVSQLPESAQDELAGWFAGSAAENPGRPDVRIASASECELTDPVSFGWFRPDLAGCLGSITVWLPPLRERRRDIPLLADSFLRRAGETRSCAEALSSQDLAILVAHDWPGNLTELESFIAAVVQAGTPAAPAAIAPQGGLQ